MSVDKSCTLKLCMVGSVAFVAGIAANRVLFESSSRRSNITDHKDGNHAVPTDKKEALERKLPSSEVCGPGTSPLKQVSSSPGNTQSAAAPQRASDVELIHDCKPPFPPELTQLLCTTSLCYLTTKLPQEKNLLGYQPLSSMNFTYWKAEEVLIMTWRRHTQKLENLLGHPSVAVLVHDFPQDQETFVNIPLGSTSPEMLAACRIAQQQSEAETPTRPNKVPAEERAMYPVRQRSRPSDTLGRTCSVTIYGVVRIVEDPAKEEYYRGIHLANNPRYHNFIAGDDIAVILVDVEAASICNIHGPVSEWSGVNASAALQKLESLDKIEAEQRKSS